jgi:hypothetical protein
VQDGLLVTAIPFDEMSLNELDHAVGGVTKEQVAAIAFTVD